MSDIKLVSEEYTSKFVTGPVLDQKLANKQDTLQWYHESATSPWNVDIAANEVTLRAGVDTVGMIYEDTKLELSNGIDIKTKVYGNWKNILSSEPVMDSISLGDSDTSIYCNGTLYDKNGNEIFGGSKWIADGTDGSQTYLSLGRDENETTVNSIFVCGPMYHKDHGASIEFIGGWNTGGVLMKVAGGGAAAGENAGVIIENKNSNTRLTLSPYLCTYYEGPCIGYGGGIDEGSLDLVGGKGTGVKIVARNSSGAEKSALITYDNIDKLINLLNS